MKAIVHIGFPKAGSSSVQVTFSRNRRRLAELGWRYAFFTQFNRESQNHGGAFINLYSDDAENFIGNLHTGKSAAEQRARFGREMDANFDTDLPLIFSGEVISSMSVNGLQALRKDFERRGRPPRVIAFIRPPRSLLNSVSQQKIRNGWPDLLPASRLEHLLSKKIERVREVFPDAEFYPFERVKTHPKGPMGFLADLIEPGLAERLTEYRRNESVSANATLLIRHLNVVLPFYVKIGKQRVSPLRLQGDNRPLMRLSGEKFYLRAGELAPVLDQLDEQNAWLAEHLGPEFCDRDDALPDDRPVAWTDAHAVELRRILRRLPKPLRVAAASYFEGRDDVPGSLRALPARHRMGGNWFLRYVRGGPGVGTLEKAYRKLRRQW